MSKDYKFEVHTESDGKAVIESVFADEKTAKERAEYLMAQAKFPVIRIIRTGGGFGEKIIFENKAAGGGSKPIAVNDVEDIALCANVADFYRYPARRTVLKALRQYFDEQGVTPTELLHSPMMIYNVQREEAMFASLLHRFSAAQAAQMGVPKDKRMNELLALYKEAINHAKNADTQLAPFAAALKNDGMAGLMAKLAELPTDQQPRAANYAFAARLSQCRDWAERIQSIASLGVPNLGTEALGLLDEMLAEILDGNAPAKSLLGYMPDLANALLTLASIAGGQRPEAKNTNPVINALADALRDNYLPLTRAVLVERVSNALAGSANLTRENKTADGQALLELMKRLINLSGYNGGAKMSFAITRRYRSLFGSEYENLSSDQAIGRIMGTMPTPSARIGYLLDLMACELPNEQKMFVMKQLVEQFTKTTNMASMFGSKRLPDNSQGILEDFRARLYASGIPKDLAQRFIQRMTTLMTIAEESGKPDTPFEEIDVEATFRKVAGSVSLALLQRNLAGGEFLFRQGEVGSEAYAVQMGELEVLVHDGEKQLVVGQVGRGEIVGEMAIIDNVPRMASVRAKGDAIVTIIPKNLFQLKLQELEERDPLLLRLMESFSRRLRSNASAQLDKIKAGGDGELKY